MTGVLSSSFTASAAQARHRLEAASRPFSIRLTAADRRRLEGEAGSQALGTYVRARLLDNVARRRSGVSAADRVLLGQILGRLGRLKAASGLSDLASAAKGGAITMTPDLEQDVHSACREICDMRLMLMQALGLKLEARA